MQCSGNFLYDDSSAITFSTTYPIAITIETSRLFIRSYQKIDFNNCKALYSSKTNTQYFDYGIPLSEANILQLVSNKGQKYFKKGEPFGLFSIFLKETMTFIGQIDLVPTSTEGIYEIGFIISNKHQNKGYCSEAMRSFVNDFVNKINLTHILSEQKRIIKIIATVHPDNHSSRRVLEKNGMKFEKAIIRFDQARLLYGLYF